MLYKFVKVGKSSVKVGKSAVKVCKSVVNVCKSNVKVGKRAVKVGESVVKVGKSLGLGINFINRSGGQMSLEEKQNGGQNFFIVCLDRPWLGDQFDK